MLKRIVGITLAVLMILAIAVPAFAEEGNISIFFPSWILGDHEDYEFAAYKILDLEVSEDGSSVLYHVPNNADLRSFFIDYFEYEIDVDDIVEPQFSTLVSESIFGLGATEKMDDFAKKVYKELKYEKEVVPDFTFKGDEEISVPYGYYVISPLNWGGTGKRSAVIAVTIRQDTSIKMKADLPRIWKNIIVGIDEDGEEVWEHVHHAAIGDKIDFVLETFVPDMRGFTEEYILKITDTMGGGLTLIDEYGEEGAGENGFQVTVKGEVLNRVPNAFTDEDGMAYHVEITPPSDVHITTIRIYLHNMLQYKELWLEDIEIRYSALLNDDAGVGGQENDNEVMLEHSNNPLQENEVGVAEEKPITSTFTAGVVISKFAVDEEDSENKTELSGAKFKLVGPSSSMNIVKREAGHVFEMASEEDGHWWLLNDDRYTEHDPNDGVFSEDKYADPDQRWKISENHICIIKDEENGKSSVEGWVDSSGMLKFTGLDTGTYTLTELVSPMGYKLLNQPVVFTIEFDHASSEWEVGGGSDGAVRVLYQYVEDGEEKDGQGFFYIDVENVKGQELPTTGGIGTTLFTIGGLLLVGIAVAVIMLRRRAAASK